MLWYLFLEQPQLYYICKIRLSTVALEKSVSISINVRDHRMGNKKKEKKRSQSRETTCSEICYFKLEWKHNFYNAIIPLYESIADLLKKNYKYLRT